jgi:hypothetical protein
MNELFYQMVREAGPEKWHLKIMRDARGAGVYHWRDLAWARRVDVAPPFEIAVKKLGERRDVTFEVAGGAPVLSSRAARTVRLLAGNEIELIPARVEGESDEYFVLNVLHAVKCLDEEKTQYVEKWTSDSYRPDRAGEYKTLRGIVIDPKLAGDHRLFRLWGSYSSGVIAAGAVKEGFEREGLSGASFTDLCSPRPSFEEEIELARERQRRYDRFYEQLFGPLAEAYGPVRQILNPLVGFDGGGPVKICMLGTDLQATVYATCELAVREAQRPSRVGRYELCTTSNSSEWASAVLTRVAQLSMTEVLDEGHTVDLGTMPRLPGSLHGVLLDVFSRSRIESEDYAIFRCIAITRPEMDFARRRGGEKLRELLIAAGAYMTTGSDRESVV